MLNFFLSFLRPSVRLFFLSVFSLSASLSVLTSFLCLYSFIEASGEQIV